jgi:hypothetical protein
MTLLILAGVPVYWWFAKQKSRLTTKDTKKLFLKSRAEREIPLVARH